MEMSFDVNWLAVVVAAVVAFAIGGVWYTVLGKQWMTAVGKTREELQGNSTAGYIGGAIAALVSAIILALIIVNLDPDRKGSALNGAVAGILSAVGFGATVMLADVLFTGRRLTLWLINTGHQLVALAASGAILAAWR
ncbi:MAG: DUF1761 domain-containing protein [Chloroflexi bacterium]|nr:DUF1761 domain-containing protein [Chloroflexota bacterium]